MQNEKEIREFDLLYGDEQRLWLNEGDEALLRPYEGKMESDQLGDTLEHLYPSDDL